MSHTAAKDPAKVGVNTAARGGVEWRVGAAGVEASVKVGVAGVSASWEAFDKFETSQAPIS